MKRIFSFFIVFVFIFSLSACKESDNSQKSEKSKASVEETVLIDNDECLVSVKGVDEDAALGFSVVLYLENKSTDKTYMFTVDTASVNGVDSDPLFAVELPPETKSNESFAFLDSSLEENGITKYTDIKIDFSVSDSDDWLAEPVAEKTVHLYPYGKENAKKFERKSLDSDIVIVDNDIASVIVTGFEEDEIFGYTAKLYLVNKTDKELMFTCDDVTVNGYKADPYFARSVTPSTSAFASISWYEETFEENGIKDVEKIKFLMRAYDVDDILADDLISEKVEIKP